MPEETPLAPSEGFNDLKAEVVERGIAEPRKKRGRPSKADLASRGETSKSVKPPNEPKPDFLPVETVVEIVALPFDLYANRKGTHWKLTVEEKEQIGKLAGKVLTKHVPAWMDQWGDEIALATVLSMAILGRVLVDIAKVREIENKTVIPQFNSYSPNSNMGETS